MLHRRHQDVHVVFGQGFERFSGAAPFLWRLSWSLLGKAPKNAWQEASPRLGQRDRKTLTKANKFRITKYKDMLLLSAPNWGAMPETPDVIQPTESKDLKRNRMRMWFIFNEIAPIRWNGVFRNKPFISLGIDAVWAEKFVRPNHRRLQNGPPRGRAFSSQTLTQEKLRVRARHEGPGQSPVSPTLESAQTKRERGQPDGRRWL